MASYKVEKDGLAFYVQPFMLDYYAANGYTIYKTVEKEITNVAAEMASIDAPSPVVKEVTVNG